MAQTRASDVRGATQVGLAWEERLAASAMRLDHDAIAKPDTPERQARVKLLGFFVLGAAFSCGVIVGALLVTWLG